MGLSISYRIFLLVLITASFNLNVLVWMKRIWICVTEGKKI